MDRPLDGGGRREHRAGKYEHSLCPVWKTHQRVTSAEQNFNNQMNKVIWFVGPSQFLSPANPVIIQWAHNKSLWWQGWRFSMNAAAWTSAHHCWVSILPARETHVESLICHHSRMTGHLPVAGLLHQTTSIMEEVAPCSYWKRPLTLDMGLPSLHAVLLPKTTTWPYRRLPWYSPQQCFRPRNLLSRKWGAHAHGVHWSHHVPYHSEKVGFTEWWNSLLKTELGNQLGDNTLYGWAKVLQKPAYTLNEHPTYDAVIPTVPIH